MKHYVVLFQESKIGRDAWLSTHWIQDGLDDNNIPTTEGLFSDFKKDMLDIQRAVHYLEGHQWRKISGLVRPITDPETGKVLLEKEASLSFKGLTIDEFLIGKCGAVTGVFFDPEGSYLWHQRYFLDLTKPT